MKKITALLLLLTAVPAAAQGWVRYAQTDEADFYFDSLRTRKMGDMVVVDAHIEIDGRISVEQGHDIAVAARDAVMRRHRVLNVMTHVDPHGRPDLDHAV